MTNTSALSAASALRRIDSNLGTAKENVTTGLRVQTASDNAAYWSIATTIRSDNKTLSAVEDSLGLGAAMVDTASTGMTSAIDVMDKIKSRLVAGREPGVDRDKVNAEITELRQQLVTIADASSFNGANWLKYQSNEQPASAQPIEIVGSVSRNGGTFEVNTLHYDRHGSALSDSHVIKALVDDSLQTQGEYGILTSDAYAAGLGFATGYTMIQGSGTSSGGVTPVLPQAVIGISSTTTDHEIEEMISVTDAMLLDMTTTAAELGTAGARIDQQSAFVHDLRDTMDRGTGRLVDAEMNNESARLKALTTQQQLGMSALAIANRGPENIQSLYRS